MMAQALDRNTILPSDAVYEILLRLPARPLCRFRVVCRSWRSLTTDPVFIQAHDTYHRLEQLLVVANDGGDAIHTMDLAGNVVKKMLVTGAAGPCRHLIGPMCLVRTPTSVGILDLANGTVYASFPADGGDYMTGGLGYRVSYALGRSVTTGEYKMLCIRVRHPIMDSRHEHRCDVFTLLDDGSRFHGWWRRRPSPPVNVRPSFPIHDVVVDGVAYFLSDHIADNAQEPDSISSFHLEKEEWGAVALRGPLSSHGLLDNNDEEEEYGMDGYIGLRCELGLAKVNGWLVTIRNQWRNDSSVDLWFLKDMEKGVWVKQFKIQRLWPLVPRPLMVLDDGRIVFSVEVVSASHHALQLCDDSSTPNVVIVRMYDPRTDETTDVTRVEGKEIVGVYAGESLLRPRNI